MVSFDLDQLLTLVQTIAIIAALVVTLYFSQRQVQAFSVDLESRVLNDIDEKFHHLAETFITSPTMVRTIYEGEGREDPATPVEYYVVSFCAHIFHMRQRHLISDNEWAGGRAWIQNAFRFGSIGTDWRKKQMDIWFDPQFRKFVERELEPEVVARPAAPHPAATQGA